MCLFGFVCVKPDQKVWSYLYDFLSKEKKFHISAGFILTFTFRCIFMFKFMEKVVTNLGEFCAYYNKNKNNWLLHTIGPKTTWSLIININTENQKPLVWVKNTTGVNTPTAEKGKATCATIQTMRSEDLRIPGPRAGAEELRKILVSTPKTKTCSAYYRAVKSFTHADTKQSSMQIQKKRKKEMTDTCIPT